MKKKKTVLPMAWSAARKFRPELVLDQNDEWIEFVETSADGGCVLFALDNGESVTVSNGCGDGFGTTAVLESLDSLRQNTAAGPSIGGVWSKRDLQVVTLPSDGLIEGHDCTFGDPVGWLPAGCWGIAEIDLGDDEGISEEFGNWLLAMVPLDDGSTVETLVDELNA